MNVMRFLIKRLAVLASLALMTGSVFGQGALTPSGAPAPTMKSLDQIEPRRVISSLPFVAAEPGGYVVTGNLSMESGNGISVTASDVTIDLNGFVLTGNVAGGGHGVHVATGVENVAIRNGVLRDWGADGVHALGAGHVTVRDIRIHNSAGNGVALNKGALIETVCADNGLAGARVALVGFGSFSVSKRSRLTGNGGDGVEITGHGEEVHILGMGDEKLKSCVISGNAGHGISWISDVADATHRLVLSGVACDDNTLDGIRVDVSGAAARFRWDIDGVRASGNGGDGAHVKLESTGGIPALFGAYSSFSDNGGHGVHVEISAVDAYMKFEDIKGEYVGNGGAGLRIEGGGHGFLSFDGSDFSNNTGDGLRTGRNPQTGKEIKIAAKNVSAAGNGGHGITLTGFGDAYLADTVIHDNADDGLVWEPDGDLRTLSLNGCRIDHNAGNGVTVENKQSGATCTVSVRFSPSGACKFAGNTGHGLYLHAQAAESVLALEWHHAHADGNGGDGVHLTCSPGAGAVEVMMEGGTCDRNTHAGLRIVNEEGIKPSPTHNPNRVSFSGNGGHGVHVAGAAAFDMDACRVTGNGGDGVNIAMKALDKSSPKLAETVCRSNAGHGVHVVASGGVVTGMVLVTGGVYSDNGLDGIHVAETGVQGGVLKNVTLSGNGGQGIDSVAHNMSVRDNVVLRNGESGIRVAGSGNRLSGNLCVGNVNGIELAVTSSDNAVLRNDFGGGAAQIAVRDHSGGHNAVAPVQAVDTGTNPLGNTEY